MAKRAAAQRIGLKYIGGGYFPGLPARDLTTQDLTDYAAEIALIEASGNLAMLYEEVTGPAATVEENSTNA